MWENFFHNEKQFYNPYINQLKEYEEYIIYEKEKMDELKGKWNKKFHNENDIFIEIGSGAGNFTVKNAEKYNDRNYIGVELRFKRLVFSAKKSKKRELKNLVFLRRRGEELKDFIENGEIAGIYINFPDPWEKKRQKKNRILQKKLFDNVYNILNSNGKIFFKTDHTGYYEDVLELMKDVKNYKVIYHTNDLHNSEKAESNIITEFEELFLKKGIKIKYIEIEKEV